MHDRDVELGLLSSRPSEATSNSNHPTLNDTHGILHPDRAPSKPNLKTDDYGEGDEKHGASPRNHGVSWDFADVDEDRDFVKLPRKKVEQLMGMWIDVLQQSLHKKHEQPIPILTPMERSSTFGQRSGFSTGNSRYPPISYPPDAHPWSTVEPMAPFELEAENGWRRLGRKIWKTPENLAHLEDCWKHLWEPMVGVDKGLFQWPVQEEARRAIQYDLVDALNANERIVSANMYMRRDFRAISSFVALIGLRLNDQYRACRRHPEIKPLQQIRILIECIWACNAFDPSNDIKEGYREGPRLSNVLIACYKRRIFYRPDEGFDELVIKTVLQRHSQAVRRSLHLLNILEKHQISVYMPCETLDQARELWSMPLPDLETPRILTHRTSTLRDGADAFLRIDDFNLRDLQTLGHLQIQWTSYWDEHLQLETSSTANILKIYWFQPKLARYLVEKYAIAPIVPVYY